MSQTYYPPITTTNPRASPRRTQMNLHPPLPGTAQAQQLNCAKGKASTLSVLHSLESSNDIVFLMLQEPWIDDDGSPPSVRGFTLHTPVPINPRCATYVRKDVGLQPRLVSSFSDTVISLLLTFPMGEVEIMNVYGSPPKELAKFLSTYKPYRNFYLAGDFNIHHPWWYTEESEEYINLIRISSQACSDFIPWTEGKTLQLANTPGIFTHFPRNQSRPSIIDLTFFNMPDFTIYSWHAIYNDGHGSDHCLTYTIWASTPFTFQPKRLFTKTNWKLFNQHISQVNEQELPWHDPKATTRSAEYITDKITEAIHLFTPLSTPHKRHKTWWNNDLTKLKKKLAAVQRFHRKSPTPSSSAALKRVRKEWAAEVQE